MACLKPEQIRYKAEGKMLWAKGEKHLEICGRCQSEVETAEKEIAVRQISKTKPRVNKIGRSHRGYINAIT
ncbi:TPA: hypothetical protein DCG61_02100 [Patescibacteria group bacterium]|nr:hypothetical protein [Patescibacteria group bacterium]